MRIVQLTTESSRGTKTDESRSRSPIERNNQRSERDEERTGRGEKTLLRSEEDRDMWERLFKDCNKKQREEIERLRQEYKERSERQGLATAMERSLPVGNVPRG